MIAAGQFSRLRAALDMAQANAATADRLAADVGWFTPDSTAAAMRTDAAATRTLADVMEAKLTRWMVSLDPISDAQVADFIAACGATSNEALTATHDLNQTGAMLSTVAADTAKDAGKVLAIGGTVAAVVAVLVVAVFYRPARSR